MNLLSEVIPFRFLTLEDSAGLLPELVRVEYEPLEKIIEQGDPDDKRVYLLESGAVEVRDYRGGADRLITTIDSGHYFGEWEPLFDRARTYSIHAATKCVCFWMSGERFLELLATNRAFAQGLGVILRDKQGIFTAFDHFKTELMRGILAGNVALEPLLVRYRELEPALHPLVNSPSVVDWKALNYAVRRLPENVSRTFAFLLTDELPTAYGDPDRFYEQVETAARRRSVWEMLPGKNLVLLRNGLSDLVDLVTLLCLYAVEAEKIRKRLADPELLYAIQYFLGELEGVADPDERKKVVGAFIRSLPFSRDEAEGLLQIWPEAAATRISDIVRHREMFSIDVRRHTNTYNSRRSELWTSQLAVATRSMLGSDPAELPSSIRVHIISSNTHSVSNCLNPWYTENKDAILSWARERNHPLIREPWNNELDAAYAVVRDYFLDNPARAEESKQHGRERGILRLEQTASTGIQVQLVDLRRLTGCGLDPMVGTVPSGDRDLVVNIDYAFGEQAEHIIRNLLMLYGRNVQSINFLGKAGALVGSRGDILIPTAFVRQSNDLFQPLPPADLAAAERLRSSFSGQVHTGPLLTVDGTLLQNLVMLRFYRHIWRCVGIEMEGAFYHGQVMESRELGVIPDDVSMRFYYYVSDLPMNTSHDLSARLGAHEGIPPLYAITREILRGVLGKS